MNAVQIEQKSYEMPPREGISIAHFLTVADVERSARYYERVTSCFQWRPLQSKDDHQSNTQRGHLK
jgi:hypothetical protein